MESPYTSSTNGWSFFYTSLWESSLEHQGRSMAGLQDTSSSPHQSPPSRPPGFLLTLSQTEPGSSATLRGQTGRKEAHWPRHPLCIHAQSRHQHPSFPAHPGHGGHCDPRGQGAVHGDPEEDGLTLMDSTSPLFSSSTPGSALDPYSSCNKNCECQTDSFTPVCGADGITYLSACFAGCSSTVLLIF